MKKNNRFHLEFFSILLLALFSGSCRQKDSAIQQEKTVAEAINGLSMEVSLANPEKRFVEVTWRNAGDKDLVVTLSTRYTGNSGEALSWPYFEPPKKMNWRPHVMFTGYVEYGDKSVELVEVLKLNGIPLLQIEKLIEEIDWHKLAPGEKVSALFDLGSLFDGIPEKEIDMVKVVFTYKCWDGRAEYDDWRGHLESNSLELKR